MTTLIDEEKVTLMTRMAIYERKEGKHAIEQTSYYKRDYVNYNVLKSMIWGLIGFLLIVGMVCAVNIETVVTDVLDANYKSIAILLACCLGGFLLCYYLIARILYSYRYDKMKKSVTNYRKGLKKLQEIYHQKDKEVEQAEYKKGSVDEENDEFISY